MRKICVFLALVLLSVSCAAKQDYRPESASYRGSTSPQTVSEQGGGDDSSPAQEMKFIYTADVTFSAEEKKMEARAEAIKALLSEETGYVSSYANNYLVLRVRAEHFDSVIALLENTEGYRRKRINAQDVTEQYRDLHIRLENLEKFKARYEELLSRAANVEEMLGIERELERVTREIETLKGRILYLENQISFSTIRINIEKKVKPGILGYVFYGIYRGVEWLFVR
jgi:hypothetical protein